MKALIQRVSTAKVIVKDKTVGSINQGLCVFLGIHPNDNISVQKWMIEKLINIRLFEDSSKKMNLSVQDVKGGILVVSQFTLYGDCSKGRRPSFAQAAPPLQAKKYYEDFLVALQNQYKYVQSGVFGAMMDVKLINDGPVTLLLQQEATS